MLRRLVVCLALFFASLAFGFSGSGASALGPCTAWAWTPTVTSAHCLAATNGYIRAYQLCVTGHYGFYQYGGWAYANAYSFSPVCGGYISARGYQV